jgi:hypothetical protein
MKKAEIILGIIAFIAMVLNLLLVPGGASVTILSLSVLSMVYMYLSFALFNGIRLRNILKRESYRTISSWRIFGSVGAGFSLSTSIMGILFRFMSWPGAAIMLMMGLATTAVVFVVVLIKYLESNADFYRGIGARLLIYGLLALALFTFPRDKWVAIKFRNHPEYVNAVKAAYADPDNLVLRAKEKEETDKMFHNVPENNKGK